MGDLGIDIGGANIKVALARGGTVVEAISHPFALWKHPQELASKLHSLLSRFGQVGKVAATMTGELCDCYATKAEGVRAIVEGLDSALNQSSIRQTARWWSTAGHFVDSAAAKERWPEVAAANWSAAAHWIGRKFPKERILWVDIGSTTTDLIPIVNGHPATRGKTDPERLQMGELIYAGVRRTPLCALMGLEGAAELFATTDDLFGILGMVADCADDCDTADGRPRLRSFRLARLARMLAADRFSASEERLVALATQLKDRLLGRIVESIRCLKQRQGEPFQGSVVSGSGEFLAKSAADAAWEQGHPCREMSRSLGSEVSGALPAAALAEFLSAEDR